MAGKWRGKGKGKGKSNGGGYEMNPQMLEMKFQMEANNLFEKLMNWHSMPQDLENGWRNVMGLRTKSIAAYGGMAGGGGAAGGGVASGNWKGDLSRAWCKHFKKSATKDDIAYTTEEVEGGYMSTVVVTGVDAQYQGLKPSKAKKDAEAEAAKACLQAEFPEYYQEAQGGWAPAPQPQGRGQKRKLEDDSSNGPKQNLMNAAQLMKGESLTKGDVTYEVEEKNGKYVATVTLVASDPNTGYQGLPGASKSDAENKAAEAALNELEAVVKPLREAHQAKKKAKNQANLEALKKRQEEKKAAAQAEKEAA